MTKIAYVYFYCCCFGLLKYILFKYMIKHEVSPLIKILYSSQANPRHMYNVLSKEVDRVLKPTLLTVHYQKSGS